MGERKQRCNRTIHPAHACRRQHLFTTHTLHMYKLHMNATTPTDGPTHPRTHSYSPRARFMASSSSARGRREKPSVSYPSARVTGTRVVPSAWCVLGKGRGGGGGGGDEVSLCMCFGGGLLVLDTEQGWWPCVWKRRVVCV